MRAIDAGEERVRRASPTVVSKGPESAARRTVMDLPGVTFGSAILQMVHNRLQDYAAFTLQLQPTAVPVWG
ncbi:hypothetical protein Asp14428_48620 [Actinoplanes sp. NBRC 14428]|nr:hypothetical protein Asp14428_48620 [Actinoplanes sp. NBRC 14428]